jgi:hypothetical protein
MGDRLLDLASTHITRLESGNTLTIQTGHTTVVEDPIASIRRLGLVLRAIEVVDKSLIGLADGFRSQPIHGAGGPSTSEGAILEAMETLPRD